MAETKSYNQAGNFEVLVTIEILAKDYNNISHSDFDRTKLIPTNLLIQCKETNLVLREREQNHHLIIIQHHCFDTINH